MPDAPAKIADPVEKKTLDLDVQVCRLRFVPDGSRLVAGAYDGSIRRFAVEDEGLRELEPVRGHHGWVWRVAVSPDGRVVYAADSWGGLAAWPLADERPQAAWSVGNAHDGWVRDMDLSADGTRLVTGGRDAVVRLWSSGGERLREFRGHEHEVYAVATSPDGQAVVSADLMGTVKHWDAGTGECVRTLAIPEMHFLAFDQDVAGIYRLSFVDEGRTLVVAGSRPAGTGNVSGKPTIRRYEWQTLKLARELVQEDVNQGFVHDLELRPEGFWSVVTSGQPGKGQLLFWRTGEPQPFFASTKFTNAHSIDWHPDGRRFVVCSTNRNHQGNGAVRDAQGKYLGNFSPLHLLTHGPAGT